VKRIAARLAVVLMVAGVPWWMLTEWVPDATLAKLKGASREEVRQLLGEPAPESDPDRWYYRRADNFNEFRVDFGEDGRVKDWSYDR
jgi:hypothetical protein